MPKSQLEKLFTILEENSILVKAFIQILFPVGEPWSFMTLYHTICSFLHGLLYFQFLPIIFCVFLPSLQHFLYILRDILSKLLWKSDHDYIAWVSQLRFQHPQ